MKTCSTCKQEKLFSEFSKYRANRDGYHSQCKSCAKEYMKSYRELNRTFLLKQMRDNALRNREKRIKYKELNKGHISSKNREYKYLNKSKINAATAKRRAKKLSATPKWLTKEELQQIEELYEIAQAFKLYTGQEYHVDHIVPLQGNNVCGLHVPWNLQILEASENLSKHNKLLEN